VIRQQGEGAWIRVVMKEGRKREIREIGKQIGLPIVKLVRVRIGSLTLGPLKPGEWVALKDEEVQALKESASAKPAKKPEKKLFRREIASARMKSGAPALTKVQPKQTKRKG